MKTCTNITWQWCISYYIKHGNHDALFSIPMSNLNANIVSIAEIHPMTSMWSIYFYLLFCIHFFSHLKQWICKCNTEFYFLFKFYSDNEICLCRSNILFDKFIFLWLYVYICIHVYNYLCFEFLLFSIIILSWVMNLLYNSSLTYFNGIS